MDGWAAWRCGPRSAIPIFTVVQVNEAKGGPDTAAHLLEFDSVHGRWPIPVTADSAGFTVKGQRIGFSNGAAPEEIAGIKRASKWCWNARENS